MKVATPLVLLSCTYHARGTWSRAALCLGSQHPQKHHKFFFCNKKWPSILEIQHERHADKIALASENLFHGLRALMMGEFRSFTRVNIVSSKCEDC